MMLDMGVVCIVARDSTAGKLYYVSRRRCQISAVAQAYCRDRENDEILLVIFEDQCVYSKLMATKPITWRDIAEFFA